MATFTVWYGKPEPLTAVGAHQCRLLSFLERYKGWHTVATDRATMRAVKGLLNRGSIAYNPVTNQARIVYAQGA